MASKSVTTFNRKRKNQVESVAHGEDLVGRRINVWWPKDETYYEGTVKSFQPRKKKHEVFYDDGETELINLKKEKWELVEEVLDCTQSAEHGENLVGSKIEVWWPADKRYYKGVVGSFDRSKMKHKVLYDDGDEDDLDLNKRKWALVEDVSVIEPELALPISFLPPQALAKRPKGAQTRRKEAK